MCWRFFIWKVRRNSSLDSIARTPTDMVAACITGSSVKMDSTPFGYLASTSGSKYNSLQVFDKLIVLCDIVWIVQLWPLRIYRWGKCRSSDSRRQTLVERLIHKVCPELDANLARMLFVRVYETSPCTPLLFPLRKQPESPTSLLSVWFFCLQTLQFAAQGYDLRLVCFALIIFLWMVLATSATFICKFRRLK